MIRFADPAELTADERTRELARLLAVGLLRLGRPSAPASPRVDSSALELSPAASVTGHDG